MEASAKKPALGAKRPGLRLHIISLCVILLLCVGLFMWAGAVFLPDGIGLSRREMVNDDYSTVEGPFAAGDELRQEITVEGRLYGVVLDVATYNRVARGTLHLALEDSAGNVLARSNTDMTQLLDNTFHRFVFENMVDAGAGAVYTLVVTAAPESAEDVLGFWRSEGPPEDVVTPEDETPKYDLAAFSLTLNGEKVDGMLALQYLTHYSGTFIIGVYSFFAAVLTTFFLLLYIFVFMRKTPLHRVFLFAALVLGMVFLFLIPPRTAPDEYVHIAGAYHNTNVLMGQPELGGAGTLTVRAGDEMDLHNYDYGATDIFAYQDMYENLWQRAPGGAAVVMEARVDRGFPPLYFAPTVGVFLARLLGFGRVGLLLMGRLANLVFYSVVASRAIKRMPVAKPLLFCIALLPMSLQLAASFSYDAYVLALSFYFIALCLQYAYRKEKMTPRSMVALGLVAVLLAPAKAVYLAMVPLVLFIPNNQYKDKKQRILGRVSVLAAALVVWSAFNLTNLQSSFGAPAVAAPAVTQEGNTDINTTPAFSETEERAAAPAALAIAPGQKAAPVQVIQRQAGALREEQPVAIAENGDAAQKFTLSYILRHIPQTIKLVLNTLWTQGPLWLQGLLGGRLGEIIAIDIEVNWLFVIGMLLVLCMAALPDEQDKLVLDKKRRWGTLGISLAVAALFVLACIFWTPVNYETIFGVQGRYFLPVLPLLFLAARGGNLRFQKPVGRTLAYAMACLVVLCQLNAFLIIIGM